MAKNYQPSEIEPKWQARWQKKPLSRAQDFSKKQKYYVLEEWPYLSGEGLHIGHTFTDTIGDILARYKRMSGFNVLHPMGWDAFGLPTENSAIKTGIPPAILTARNAKRFRKQISSLGLSYDWTRETDSSNPQYYRWTQWIFLQLFKHGLAYKAETPVGWCPSCKIILANEEIVAGKCERCGAEAEYRRQKQWLLKITKYADRLADELDLVDYPDYVKKSQRDWIGRTEGVEIVYPVVGSKMTIACYSTRPETNFGATFVVIAPEHPLVSKLTTPENKNAVSKYIKESKKKSELERTELSKEKTGVFTGSYALNRLTNKKMPIWVADFVVLTAGTGIVVGVPAHDQRDFEFAKEYGLEIIPVIKPKSGPPAGGWDFNKGPYLEIGDERAVVFNSGFLDGLTPLKAIEKVTDYLVKKGWSKKAKNYHLRDWIFSRQHYWGEPIPIIDCPKCGSASSPQAVPVPEKDLPIKLPEVEKYQPTDTGESPLAKIKDWVNVVCPKCGSAARRETDTMPNWAGSSWYYLRFCDPKNAKQFGERSKLNYWLPVDIYLGGAEHTTLHLLYSRFWHKFLNDIGVVPGKEPYVARRQHGVILGEDGFRMSKSRGNVVNPDAVVAKFGADTLRVYLMFMGPYDSTMPWNTKGLEGCYRFLSRIWRLYSASGRTTSASGRIAQKTSAELRGPLNRLIKKVGEDIEALKHNTAIAALMEFLNAWNKQGSLSRAAAGDFLKLLAPFAPHLSEELWCEALKNKYSIHQQPWPKYQTKLIQEKEVVIVIQVNGKVRGQVQTQFVTSKKQGAVEKLALKEPRVAKYLSGQKIKKTIFVPGRLINFVI
jgi:leucyl-tRNA synthetase